MGKTMAMDELKRLGRSDLLQLLLEAEEENEMLKAEVADLKDKLADRAIQIEKCGDLATAAMELNGVFTAAQAACRQYEENIKRQSEGIEEKCNDMLRETENKCRRMERDTEYNCHKKVRETDIHCREMEEETNYKCQRILKELKEKYKVYFNQEEGTKEVQMETKEDAT